jgi:hypothetical protein
MYRIVILAVSILTCALIALPSRAAERVTLVANITEKGKERVETQILTLDGDRVRIDLPGTEGKVSASTPYLLTIDGGDSWVLADDDEAFCTRMETDRFFRDVGSSLRRLGKLVGLKVAPVEMTRVFEKPGPEILGYSTMHVRLESTVSGEARLVVKKYEYTAKIIEDIWYATDLEMHPIRKKWIAAATQSGIPGFDELTDKWIEHVQGAVAKQVLVMELTDVVKGKTTITREETEVTAVEQLEPAQLPEDVFKLPDCTDDKTSVTDAAKRMLDLGQMRP